MSIDPGVIEEERRQRVKSEIRTLIVRMFFVVFALIVLTFVGLSVYDSRWKAQRVVVKSSPTRMFGVEVVGFHVESVARGRDDGPMAGWYTSSETLALAGWAGKDSLILTLWDMRGREVGKVHSPTRSFWGEGANFAPPVGFGGWTQLTAAEMRSFGYPERPNWPCPWADSPGGSPAWTLTPGAEWREVGSYFGHFPSLAR